MMAIPMTRRVRSLRSWRWRALTRRLRAPTALSSSTKSAVRLLRPGLSISRLPVCLLGTIPGRRQLSPGPDTCPRRGRAAPSPAAAGGSSTALPAQGHALDDQFQARTRLSRRDTYRLTHPDHHRSDKPALCRGPVLVGDPPDATAKEQRVRACRVPDLGQVERQGQRVKRARVVNDLLADGPIFGRA